eukprot:scaffold1280_cov379-Prasinococcus_capsulatus_cf.AAC.31
MRAPWSGGSARPSGRLTYETRHSTALPHRRAPVACHHNVPDKVVGQLGRSARALVPPAAAAAAAAATQPQPAASCLASKLPRAHSLPRSYCRKLELRVVERFSTAGPGSHEAWPRMRLSSCVPTSQRDAPHPSGAET